MKQTIFTLFFALAATICSFAEEPTGYDDIFVQTQEGRSILY